jgi:hypothetical protein
MTLDIAATSIVPVMKFIPEEQRETQWEAIKKKFNLDLSQLEIIKRKVLEMLKSDNINIKPLQTKNVFQLHIKDNPLSLQTPFKLQADEVDPLNSWRNSEFSLFLDDDGIPRYELMNPLLLSSFCDDKISYIGHNPETLKMRLKIAKDRFLNIEQKRIILRYFDNNNRYFNRKVCGFILLIIGFFTIALGGVLYTLDLLYFLILGSFYHYKLFFYFFFFIFFFI